MAEHILYCLKCKQYTMEQVCKCGEKTVTTKPAKYSPDDKYKDLKRKAKRELLEKQGLL